MENITKEYDAIIGDLAERALTYLDETGDVDEAINNAIDDGLIYTDDKAYIMAWNIEQGIIEFGRQVDWDAVEENLIDDIKNEMENLQNEK